MKCEYNKYQKSQRSMCNDSNNNNSTFYPPTSLIHACLILRNNSPSSIHWDWHEAPILSSIYRVEDLRLYLYHLHLVFVHVTNYSHTIVILYASFHPALYDVSYTFLHHLIVVRILIDLRYDLLSHFRLDPQLWQKWIHRWGNSQL